MEWRSNRKRSNLTESRNRKNKNKMEGRKSIWRHFIFPETFFIQEQREEHIALSYFRTGIKKEHETKAPCLFEKEVSISPERSKRFRKTPPSFCRKQGTPTRKERLSNPKSPPPGSLASYLPPKKESTCKQKQPFSTFLKWNEGKIHQLVWCNSSARSNTFYRYIP